MAENLKRQPKKGILKNSSSFESNERQKEQRSGTKWDEMNILATLHPADKDYGHMKIEEPKTPYNYQKDESGDEVDSVDVDALTKRLQEGQEELPRAMVTPPPILEDSEEELTPEEREEKQKFEMKRKKHYNEFQAVKLARKLMEQDEEEDEEEEEKNKDSENKETLEEKMEDDSQTKEQSTLENSPP